MCWRLVLAVGLLCAIGTLVGCGASPPTDLEAALKRSQGGTSGGAPADSLARNESGVELCHVPPGHPGDAVTIVVGAAAVNAHLAHGDHLGSCDDLDRDGVGDSLDQCPDTTFAVEVDADGCACDQRDPDADGINDCHDLCPATPANEAVDEDGCPTVHVSTVAAARYHNAIGRSDGSARLWGWSNSGQVGDPPSHEDVVSIALAAGHTLLAKSNGSVLTFGENALTSSPTPVLVEGVSDIVEVAALAFGGVFLTGGGEVWGFTNASKPGCDLAGASSEFTTGALGPMPVPGAPEDVVAIAAGNHHTVALDADGVAWVWGSRFGCTPTPVLDGVVDVAAGADDLCLFVRDDGSAWAMGFNLHGQLGNGTGVSNYSTPTPVRNVANVVDVAAGDRHSMFLEEDGTLWVAGWNHDCQLGLEEEINPAEPLYGDEVYEPVPVALADVVAIAGGRTHSVAVRGDNTVWIWGLNNANQLTLGSASALPGLVCTPMQLVMDAD